MTNIVTGYVNETSKENGVSASTSVSSNVKSVDNAGADLFTTGNPANVKFATTQTVALSGAIPAGANAIGSVTVTGNPAIVGNVAHDSPVSGNPIRGGAKAINVMPTAVSSTNDIHDLITTMHGALITRPYAIPEAEWQYACPSPIIVSTDVVLKVAGGSGIRNYVKSVSVMNIHATVATEFVIKDGATVIYRGYLPVNMVQPTIIDFPIPLKGTAVTALNFACITTGASVYVNAQGYQAV